MKRVFKLRDGRKVIFYEDTIEGMAGEPMTILCCCFKDGFARLRISEVLKLMEPRYKHLIARWIKIIQRENYHSAISWTR